MSEALKPCPFCGSADIDSGRPWVSCNDCRCEGPYDTFQSDEAANRLWNTRADLPATDEQAFANEKVKALVEMLRHTTNCLDEVTSDDWDGDIDFRKVRSLIHTNVCALAAMEPDSTDKAP